MAVVAGVDFGTLSVRVSLVDSERGRLASAVAECPIHRKREDPETATQSHTDHMRAWRLLLAKPSRRPKFPRIRFSPLRWTPQALPSFLSEKISAMGHKWMWNASLGGLPPQEFLSFQAKLFGPIGREMPGKLVGCGIFAVQFFAYSCHQRIRNSCSRRRI
jgi:hypothetical protein